MLRRCQCGILHSFNGAAALWLSASAASRTVTLRRQLSGTANSACVRRSSASSKGHIRSPYRRWTESDIEMYRRLHDEGKSDVEIASALGRTIGALRLKKHHGMKAVSKEAVYWTPQEDVVLRELRDEVRSPSLIAKILDMPCSRVKGRLQLIEGRLRRKIQAQATIWSDSTIQSMTEMRSHGYTISHIATTLDVPQCKIRYKLKVLDKAADQAKAKFKRYTHDEDSILTTFLQSGKSWNDIVAAMPHRDQHSVQNRALYLGIRAPIRPAVDPWTEEDTLKLTTLRKALEPWKSVAIELGRTAEACRKTWEKLQSKSTSLESLQGSHQ